MIHWSLNFIIYFKLFIPFPALRNSDIAFLGCWTLLAKASCMAPRSTVTRNKTIPIHNNSMMLHSQSRGKPPLTTHKRVWSILKACFSCICCPPFYNIKLLVLTGILFSYESRRLAAIPILYPQHTCEVDLSSTSQECQQ